MSSGEKGEPAKAAPTSKAVGPPEGVGPSVIYKLYRGAIGEVDAKPCRIWAEFPSLELCWTPYDCPAREADRVSLLQISRCTCDVAPDCVDGQASSKRDTNVQLLVFVPHGALGREQRQESAGSPGTSGNKPSAEVEAIRIIGPHPALQEFGCALQQLVDCRETEGPSGIEFIQKRLFQYLWKHQGESKTELALYEAQAVLAFNLDPKAGIAYVRSRLGKDTDDALGEWLAQMSTQNGGLDPTMLGNYFSRRDTMEIFKVFVRRLDFTGTDIVAAMRLLFDTFKPGGEGQVISRILELFAEAYFLQWTVWKEKQEGAKANYKDSDSVMTLAVSLIMLNTGMHVASKKLNKKAAAMADMTLEAYIKMARSTVDEEQVPEESLTTWYEAIKESEISMQPLPRNAFSKLPVQPDIEGWLILIVSPTVQKRYWAVCALQRMYLFSDNSDVEPWDAIDLKDKRVQAVSSDATSRASYMADLQGKGCMASCLPTNQAARRSRTCLTAEDTMERAFEVMVGASNTTPMLSRLSKPRKRLALVAESPDLMERWVTLITSGPY